jgi:hypothetical protein
MTTTVLEPDNAILGGVGKDNPATEVTAAVATRVRDCGQPTLGSAVADFAKRSKESPDLPGTVCEPDAGAGMTEEDTVCVFEVLAEMQRIIDRHIEKTVGQQSES